MFWLQPHFDVMLQNYVLSIDRLNKYRTLFVTIGFKLEICPKLLIERCYILVMALEKTAHTQCHGKHAIKQEYGLFI